MDISRININSTWFDHARILATLVLAVTHWEQQVKHMKPRPKPPQFVRDARRDIRTLMALRQRVFALRDQLVKQNGSNP